MASLFINERLVDIGADAAPDTPLLWVLRDILYITGTKYGCGMGICGACTVHIDGKAVRSCQVTLASLKPEQDIRTIEGVNSDEVEGVRAAWEKLDVPQCGYCQSGQILSAAALLATKKKPTDADIDAAMQGNICRCATYQRIRAAIKEAAKNLGA